MDPATTCYVVFGSLIGAGCLVGNLCLYCICSEPKPNRVTPTTMPSDIIEKKRYEDLIITPPEYQDIVIGGIQAIAEQPLPPDYED